MNTFLKRVHKSHKLCTDCPSPRTIQALFDDILGLMFPDFSVEPLREESKLLAKYHGVKNRLAEILTKNVASKEESGIAVSNMFFDNLEPVYDNILMDVKAMYEGDPAAKSEKEVVRCYPGFYAIAAYRIAHSLHRLGVELIPRMITEHAHSKTGIDIHPAAQIGQRFCIDHGTGLVIGETCTIGNDVKLYQGVTLGALSVDKSDANVKRHPTIEDHVIVYAGATILGGHTIIGHHSVIGGNVWLTKSIPPHSKVYYQASLQPSQTEQITPSINYQ